jgi:transposase
MVKVANSDSKAKSAKTLQEINVQKRQGNKCSGSTLVDWFMNYFQAINLTMKKENREKQKNDVYIHFKNRLKQNPKNKLQTSRDELE